jgi:hypothetical protein
VVRARPGRRFVVTCPALPGLVTEGDTIIPLGDCGYANISTTRRPQLANQPDDKTLMLEDGAGIRFIRAMLATPI